MKTLSKMTLGAIGVMAAFWLAKFVWVLFWDVLLKILAMLQNAVMIAVVLMAVYVVYKILSTKSSSDRD